jgi:hypothetical protein
MGREVDALLHHVLGHYFSVLALGLRVDGWVAG